VVQGAHNARRHQGFCASRLSGEAIKIHMTLCFSPNQACSCQGWRELLQPVVRPARRHPRDGMKLIRDIKDLYTNYNYKD